MKKLTIFYELKISRQTSIIATIKKPKGDGKMKSAKGLMNIFMLALVIGSLAACATDRAGESGEQSAIVVNRIQEWKPVWSNNKEDIRFC